MTFSSIRLCQRIILLKKKLISTKFQLVVLFCGLENVKGRQKDPLLCQLTKKRERGLQNKTQLCQSPYAVWPICPSIKPSHFKQGSSFIPGEIIWLKIEFGTPIKPVLLRAFRVHLTTQTEHKLDVRLVIHSNTGRRSRICLTQIEIPAFCTQYIPPFSKE